MILGKMMKRYDCKIDGESSPVATNSPEKAIRIFNALRKLEIN